MKEIVQQVPFPTQGLYVSSAIAEQPEGTTPSAVNVRAWNPRLGRMQGCQRAGLSKFCPTQLNGSAPIQCLDVVVTTTPAPQTGAGIFAHLLNNATPNGITVEYWTSGGKFTITSTLGSVYGRCYGFVWDNQAHLYAVFNSGGTNTTVVCFDLTIPVATLIATGASTSQTGTVLWAQALAETVNTPVGIDVGGGFVWVSLQVGGSGGTDTRLYAFNTSSGQIKTGTFLFDRAAAQSSNATGWLSYCNGMVMVGYGVSGAVVVGSLSAYNTVTGVETYQAGGSAFDLIDIVNDGYAHFYILTLNGAATQSTITAYDTYGNQLSIPAQLTGLNPLKSIAYEPISTNILGVAAAAVGGKDMYLFNSTGITMIGTGIASSFTSHLLGARADGAGNFWLSGPTSDASAGLSFARASVSSSTETDIQKNNTAASSVPTTPRAVAAFTGYVSPLPSTNQFFARGIGVAGGTVVRFDQRGINSITGGASALSAGTPAIFSAQLGQQLFFSDGAFYKYYDIPTDSVIGWSATTAGTIPRDSQGNPARLICNWRNRIVLAGFRFDPFNYFMSAVGDAFNWAFNPVPQVETEAVAGGLSTAGKNLDIINALVPYSDEYLMMGGAHTLYWMTGDPTSGGRLDLISDTIGMAFGEPWCRDGVGNIYFLSNRGSIYRFAPGALPELISSAIEQFVLTTNMNTTLVRSWFDERLQIVHFFLTQTGGPAPATHFAYDLRNNSWWMDTFANNNLNPLAGCVFEDGDPAHRLVLLGGQDGYVRAIDPNALDDDGTAINSFAFIGPVKGKDGDGLTLADVQVDLDTSSSPVFWMAQGGPDPQTALLSPQTRTASISRAGRNRSQAARTFGHAHWIQLASQNVLQSAWALEYLRVRLRLPEGSARSRIF